MQKHGWFGKSVEVINPKTNEKKSIEVGARRLKKIFYTNTRTAYQQSRARAQEQSGDEYLRYVAILDSRTRHSHAQMHGLILKKDDPFWQKNYPPNGYNCRCRVDSYSKDDLDEFGFKESSPTQKLNVAEKDWAYDTRGLNRNDEDLLHILESKINKYRKNQPAREALEAVRVELNAQRKRYEAIKELWNAEITRDKNGKKIATRQVKLCKLSEEIKNLINATNGDLYISDKMIDDHKAKPAEIGAFEYSLIPFMVENKKQILAVFQDKIITEGNKNIYIVASKLKNTYRLTLAIQKDSARVSSLLINENAIKEMIDEGKTRIY